MNKSIWTVVFWFGLSRDLEQLQMAFWVILAAPLVVAADLRQLDASSKRILLNKRLISVNQNPSGLMGIEKSVVCS